MKTLHDGLPRVGGRRLTCSIADFERRCRVAIRNEQEQIGPDNALIALLSDAVRFTREHLDYVGSYLGEPIPGPDDERLTVNDPPLAGTQGER